MIKVLFTILLLFGTLVAAAEPLVLNWTQEGVTRTDGSPYTAADHDRVIIRYKVTSGGSNKYVKVAGYSNTTITLDVPPDTYTVAIRNVDTAGLKSVYSAEVKKVVDPKPVAKPRPPSLVKWEVPIFAALKHTLMVKRRAAGLQDVCLILARASA